MPLTPDDLATLRAIVREEVRAAINEALQRDPRSAGNRRSTPELPPAVAKIQTQGERWADQIAAFVSRPDTREGDKYVQGTVQPAALCGFDRGLMAIIRDQAAKSADDPYRKGLVQINAVRRWLKHRPDLVQFVRQEYANKVSERDPGDPP